MLSCKDQEQGKVVVAHAIWQKKKKKIQKALRLERGIKPIFILRQDCVYLKNPTESTHTKKTY